MDYMTLKEASERCYPKADQSINAPYSTPALCKRLPIWLIPKRQNNQWIGAIKY